MVHRPVVICAMLALLSAAGICSGADAPPEPSSPSATAKTGEVEFNFNERSPSSSPKEIARRLNLKEGKLTPDYDLVKRRFKAYIPKNYDPATPVGIFVYLGYKDSDTVATPWEPALDKAHMIFITPACHSGERYPNSVPLWETMGLAFDAVHKLKHLYAIDDRRVYRMAFNMGSMQTSLASADLFSGLLVALDGEYFDRLVLPNKRMYPASFAPPPGGLMQQARKRSIVIIEQDFTAKDQKPHLIVAALRQNGFNNVLPLKLSVTEDLHYPNLKADWLEQSVLPFLEATSVAPAKPVAAKAESASPPGAAGPAAATRPAAANTPAASTPPAAGAAPISAGADAQHLLSLAQLYIKNGQTKLARSKLKLILQYYPTDPAAATAKELLATIPGE